MRQKPCRAAPHCPVTRRMSASNSGFLAFLWLMSHTSASWPCSASHSFICRGGGLRVGYGWLHHCSYMRPTKRKAVATEPRGAA